MPKNITFESIVTLNGKPVNHANPSQAVTDILCREFLELFLQQKSAEGQAIPTA